MLQSALRRRKDLLQELQVRALSGDRNSRKSQVTCISTGDVDSVLFCPLVFGLGRIQSSAGLGYRGCTS